MRATRHKFELGDKVQANEKAPTMDYAGREGVVIERGPSKGEYGVRFDDGRVDGAEYLFSHWLDKVA